MAGAAAGVVHGRESEADDMTPLAPVPVHSDRIRELRQSNKALGRSLVTMTEQRNAFDMENSCLVARLGLRDATIGSLEGWLQLVCIVAALGWVLAVVGWLT